MAVALVEIAKGEFLEKTLQFARVPSSLSSLFLSSTKTNAPQQSFLLG